MDFIEQIPSKGLIGGSLFQAYLDNSIDLAPFYSSKKIEKPFRNGKKYPESHRQILETSLRRRYQGYDLDPPEELALLKDPTTFTVTTGHQLSLASGPLFTIYKIATIIRLARELSDSDNHILPVFWLASEDHDFEEIRSFVIGTETYTWPERYEKFATGRIPLSEKFKTWIQTTPLPPQVIDLYLHSKTLGEATFRLIHHLFGEYGLIVVEPDDAPLKKLFLDTLGERWSSSEINQNFEATTRELEKLGFKGQVEPTEELNFFYLQQFRRYHLEQRKDSFYLKEENDKLEHLENEQLSPNVVLRPVYQEIILPNLAYIGGPGELSYWLQLKGVFDWLDIAFPVLKPRIFAILLSQQVQEKLEKLPFTIKEILNTDLQNLENLLLKELDIDTQGLSDQREDLGKTYKSIEDKAVEFDPTLAEHVRAELARLQHRFDYLEKKFVRHQKKGRSDRFAQLTSVYEYLKPLNGLQERTTNVFQYSDYPSLIKDLINGKISEENYINILKVQ